MSRTCTRLVALASVAITALAVTAVVGVARATYAEAAGGITTPANVSVTGTTSNAITLSWSASTVSDSSGDVAAYHVMRGSDVVATSMGTSVTVSSLTPATSYSFTVVAYDVAAS